MNNPLNAYRQTRVKTAGQGKLIVMLYDEGIRQLDLSLSELDKREDQDLEKVHRAVIKAQDIITELTVSLDFEKGNDIAENLFSLYMFFNQQLLDANIRKDRDAIKGVHSMMGDLREAWVAIEGKTVQMSGQTAGGVNIAG